VVEGGLNHMNDTRMAFDGTVEALGGNLKNGTPTRYPGVGDHYHYIYILHGVMHL
jgi:hypothetical protein